MRPITCEEQPHVDAYARLCAAFIHDTAHDPDGVALAEHRHHLDVGGLRWTVTVRGLHEATAACYATGGTQLWATSGTVADVVTAVLHRATTPTHPARACAQPGAAAVADTSYTPGAKVRRQAWPISWQRLRTHHPYLP